MAHSFILLSLLSSMWFLQKKKGTKWAFASSRTLSPPYHPTVTLSNIERSWGLLINSKVIARCYFEMLLDMSLSKFPCAHCSPYSQWLGHSGSFPYALPFRVGRNKQPHTLFGYRKLTEKAIYKNKNLVISNTCDFWESKSLLGPRACGFNTALI